MDCRHVDRLLEANLDGQLSGFERVALRQHLRACRACRAKVEAMTAFSANVERTLACADGPDWRRLAPNAAPAVAPLREPEPASMPTPPRVEVESVPPARRVRRSLRPWPLVVGVVAMVVLVAMLVPADQFGSLSPRPSSLLDAALAEEATRRAAGARLDVASADQDVLARWFGDRGLPALPRLVLPAEMEFEGGFLLHYDGQRVAGLALTTPDGPVALHLWPASRPDAAAPRRGEGLTAEATALPDWQLVVLAPAPGDATSRILGAVTTSFEPAL